MLQEYRPETCSSALPNSFGTYEVKVLACSHWACLLLRVYKLASAQVFIYRFWLVRFYGSCTCVFLLCATFETPFP